MDVRELHKLLKEGHIKNQVIYGKDFLIVPNSIFNVYADNFIGPLQLGSKKNYRSNHFIKHIHAVQGKEYTEVHYDHGNMYKNPILGLIHLFVDVIPYFWWMLVHRQKPYSM